MKKILILYATAGIGHKKAALAIKEAFDKRKRSDAVLVDALDYTSGFFKSSYCSIYIFLVKYLPRVWGFFYYALDNPFIYAFVAPMRRIANYLNSKKLVKYLLETKPDTVISTHFMPSEVIAALKRKGILKTRLITVVTDYKLHLFWKLKGTDFYIAGSEYTREDFIKRGVDADRIRVFGIPCAKSFSLARDTRALRQKAGLDPDKNTIFLLGGGFGVGPIKRIASSLDSSGEDFQCIAVCGYNENLRRDIQKIAEKAKHKFLVYGFVDNVDELMAISDMLVSKSGGITVTEALNASLAMIVVDPIPGQEMRNYAFLEKNKAAAKIKRPGDVVDVIQGLIGSRKLDDIRENVKKIRLPDSAERIADEAER